MRSGYQTRVGSALEACFSTAIGFTLSYAAYFWIVAPLYDLDVTWKENFGISLIMTVLSLSRQYVVRRFMTKKPQWSGVR